MFKNVCICQVHKRTVRSAGAASDRSPPVAGHVYDVISGIPGVDIDYSVSERYKMFQRTMALHTNVLLLSD